jgi:hypothetical protein
MTDDEVLAHHGLRRGDAIKTDIDWSDGPVREFNHRLVRDGLELPCPKQLLCAGKESQLPAAISQPDRDRQCSEESMSFHTS